MITWLSSYPRSGNTLFRTILNRNFGTASYTDEVVENSKMGGESRRLVDETIGAERFLGAWDEFYEEALSSRAMYYIKTHRPPRDASKAIYIVRDGRKAIVSYLYYHRHILGDLTKSIMPLVLDFDFYGGWSEHFAAWNAANRNTLLLRYENLVSPSPETLKAISDFTALDKFENRWENPFNYLQGLRPNSFRQGSAEWQGDDHWTGTVNTLFFIRHGSLMEQLGYASRHEVMEVVEAASKDIHEINSLVSQIIQQNKYLTHECEERLKVIHILDSEVRRWKSPS
jgi:hypothetical protein